VRWIEPLQEWACTTLVPEAAREEHAFIVIRKVLVVRDISTYDRAINTLPYDYQVVVLPMKGWVWYAMVIVERWTRKKTINIRVWVRSRNIQFQRKPNVKTSMRRLVQKYPNILCTSIVAQKEILHSKSWILLWRFRPTQSPPTAEDFVERETKERGWKMWERVHSCERDEEIFNIWRATTQLRVGLTRQWLSLTSQSGIITTHCSCTMTCRNTRSAGQLLRHNFGW
jgi:hypothetical protein